jgi:hypothetical protein
MVYTRVEREVKGLVSLPVLPCSEPLLNSTVKDWLIHVYKASRIFLPKHIAQKYLSDNQLFTDIFAPIQNKYQSPVLL